MAEEKEPVIHKAYEPYQPSPTFVFSLRVFEVGSGLTTMACLAYAASGHQHIWGNIPNWIILGLAVSSTGALISLIYLIERAFKFPLVEVFTSIILSIGYLVYVILGAINIDALIKCEEIDTQTGWEAGTCATPKASEFFAFVAVFAYAFSATTAFRVWRDRRQVPSSTATGQA